MFVFLFGPEGVHRVEVGTGGNGVEYSQVDRLEEPVVLLVRPRFPRLGNRVRLARLAGLRLLHRARPLAPR